MMLTSIISIFVKVPGFEKDRKLQGEHDQLLLDLEEMFAACIFQTLGTSDLEFFLPEDVKNSLRGKRT